MFLNMPRFFAARGSEFAITGQTALPDLEHLEKQFGDLPFAKPDRPRWTHLKESPRGYRSTRI
jgi:hypothetical protein